MSYDPVQAMKQHYMANQPARRTSVEGQYSYFRISQEPLWCRLVAGMYEVPTQNNELRPQPFYLFWEHYLPPKGNIGHQFLACRRNGNEYRPVEDCPICQYLPNNDPRMVYAFTVFGLGWYHTVREPSRRDPSRMVTYQQPCQATQHNPHCTYCSQGAPLVAGKLGHARIGGQRDFAAIMQAAASVATNCQCGGSLHTHQLACPRCHVILHSIDDGITDREFRSYMQETHCRTCGVQVTPVAIDRCNSCNDPRPYNIFQADLMLSYEQDGSVRGPLKVEVTGMGPLPDEYDANAIKALDLPAIYAPKDKSALLKIARRYPGTFAPAVAPSTGGQMPLAPTGAAGSRTPVRPPTLLAPSGPTVSRAPALFPPSGPGAGAPKPIVNISQVTRPQATQEGAPHQIPPAPRPASFYPPRLEHRPNAEEALPEEKEEDELELAPIEPIED